MNPTATGRGSSTGLLLGIVFLTALAARLVYLAQFSASPFFLAPVGDSREYLERARGILRGDLFGSGIFFHSSPPYPYFLALVLGVSRGSLGAVYGVQSLVGALNCVVIALIARELPGSGSRTMFLAGMLSACTGLFAFFDGDILMISLTIFCTDLALLLLLRHGSSGRLGEAALAGGCLGLAALDKTNLLLAAPVALAFIAVGRDHRRAGRAAGAFLVALAAAILPVTARNLIVGRDLVLVSSNGGVNFFIGNNPAATGRFVLPAGSGLRDPGLAESSTEKASQAMGKPLKASEASRYWLRRGLVFWREHPADAVRLLFRKMLLLVNHYEMPNQMNYYFVRDEYAPVLRWLPFGVWFTLPLALAGLVTRLPRGLAPNEKLLLGFAAAAAVSLLPFFVTERYRLPLVPVLIVFAAAALDDLPRAVRRRAWKSLALRALVGAVVAYVVMLPLPQPPYSKDRNAVGAALFERSLASPADRLALLEESAMHYRWALETSPEFWYSRYNLGLTYEALGIHSAAAEQFRAAYEINPDFTEALVAARRAQGTSLWAKDRMPVAALPRTPYESARVEVARGNEIGAAAAYRDLLRRDPTHYAAWNELGALLLRQHRAREAERCLAQGRRLRPETAAPGR